MSLLYSKSIQNVIDIEIYSNDPGKSIIKLSGKSQYVVVFDLRAKKDHIFDLTKIKPKQVMEFDFPSYKTYDKYITFIYKIDSNANALLYASIFPYQVGQCDHISTCMNKDMLSISVTGNTSCCSIYNKTNKIKYLIYHDLKYCIDPLQTLYINRDVNLSWFTVRDTEFPCDVSYRDLSIQEKDCYIPECVIKGCHQINYNMVYDKWLDNMEHLYRGSLTYVPTNDKDFHMVDDKGNKYRYGVEHFKHIVPLLDSGKVYGSFKFVGRGSRQIKYVLLPVKSNEYGLQLCDSGSSSESES